VLANKIHIEEVTMLPISTALPQKRIGIIG